MSVHKKNIKLLEQFEKKIKESVKPKSDSKSSSRDTRGTSPNK